MLQASSDGGYIRIPEAPLNSLAMTMEPVSGIDPAHTYVAGGWR